MAVITVTPVAIVPGTETIDLPAGGQSVITTNTFAIPMPVVPGGGEARLTIYIEEQGSGAAVVTFNAGSYPPAPLAAKGPDTVTLALSDLRAYVPEAGRHMQADGTITGSVATNTVKLYATYQPRGY